MENTCECLLGDTGCDHCADEQKKYDEYCTKLYESYLWYKEEYPNEDAEP